MGKCNIKIALVLLVVILLTASIGSFAHRVHSEASSSGKSFLPLINSKIGWITECVVCIPFIDELASPSAQFDSDGVLHVAYGGDKLYYARRSGEDEWEISIVDETSGLSRATIALDSAERPHIIYRVWHRVRYASFDGSIWNIEKNIDFDDVAGTISLALDSVDNPYISYIDYGEDQYENYDDSLIYAYRSESGWHKSILYSGSLGEHSSLALDSNNKPHISFGGRDLAYGTLDGEVWEFEFFLDEGAKDPAILLDENDLPHIVYGGGRGLRYRYKTELGWHYEFIDYGDETAFWGTGVYLPSIQLDSHGDPHIGYLVLTSGPYPAMPTDYYVHYYAHRDTGTWSIEEGSLTVPFSPNTVIVDSLDQPHLIFLESSRLVLASPQQDSSWSKSTIDRSGRIGKFSLAVDSQKIPHLSYLEDTHFNPYYKYAKMTNGSWLISSVELYREPDYPYPDSSISIAPDGTAHIVLLNGGCNRFGCSYRLNHRYADDLTWKYGFGSRSFGPDIDVGYVAIDSENRPHIAHFDTYSVGEHDQVDAPYIWNKQLLADFREMGALAINSSDFPIIAGYTMPLQEGGEMIIAIRSETGWRIMKDEILKSFKSMALGPDDQLYFLSFFREPLWALGYSYQDELGWQQASVDQTATEACRQGIAIDADLGIHLAYKRDDVLVYTYINSSGTKSSTELATKVNICSFAIDSDGNPFVAYGFENDLKLVYWNPD